MTDELTLHEIAEGIAGAPTPTDRKGKCWFCGGGLGHPADGSGHSPRCPWVQRDRLVEAVAELSALREQCRAAEANFADMLKRQGRHHTDGSVTLPWSVVEAYLRRSDPAPEPEQRTADPLCVYVGCFGRPLMVTIDSGIGICAEHRDRQPDHLQPSLGRHAGLAGQEGEGT